MTFLSILLALLLERILPQTVELRQFGWLRDYSQWLQDVLHIERLGSWGGFSALLFPLLLVAWLLSGIFENALFGLFELVFNVAVVFFCLGPRDLDKQVDQYLDAIEIGESQRRFTLASELCGQAPAMELPQQVMQACRCIFVEANTRVYAILFWFALLGPLAALLYRFLEQLLRQNVLPQSLTQIKTVSRLLLGWVDWLPAHLSLFAFMISGSFEDGLQAFRRGALHAVDVFEQNQELLRQVGYQSISNPGEIGNEQQAMQMVRKSRGLVLRALVVWLLMVLLIGFFN